MLDLRQQMAELLERTGADVRMEKPDTFQDISRGLVVYAETDNRPLDPWTDYQSYDVTVYKPTFAEAVELCKEVDALVSGEAGWRRDRKSSDASARLSQDVYSFKLSYSAKIITDGCLIVRNGL